MPYLASELITNSYTLSNIIAFDLEAVSSSQMAIGLRLLNVFLDFKSTDTKLINYYTVYDFNLVLGQQKYFIPKLNSIETLTFFIGQLRFPCEFQGRVEYFGNARVEQINSIPYAYHYERVLDGMDVYLYFNPVANYPAQITGKFNLDEVALNTDLSLIFDPFYIEYCRYGLAQLLCLEFDKEFPPQKLEMLKEYESKVMDTSPADLYMQKMSTFGASRALNYGMVNLGKGWTV